MPVSSEFSCDEGSNFSDTHSISSSSDDEYDRPKKRHTHSNSSTMTPGELFTVYTSLSVALDVVFDDSIS
jgi:hypothetical protein